jgi:hypothetical protein
LAVNKGQSVNGEAIIEMFKKEIEDDLRHLRDEHSQREALKVTF